MKIKNLLNALLACSALFFVSCQVNSSKSFSDIASEDSTNVAVCVWDNVSLKETADENGKWLSSLSLGETVIYLGKEQSVETAKKAVTYYNIRLKDGKEGWSQADFIILGSKPAAIIEDSPIYSRPDLLNKTDKVFSSMDIVAVKSENNGFIEVTGKRKDGKWLETGWIKSSAVTYKDVDVAVAKFASKAMSIKEESKKIEAIEDIINNSDLDSSIFIENLKSFLPKDDIDEDSSESEGEIESDSDEAE
ncbi:MAG: hypothetical protein AB7S48_02325 [Bacteroidales bacterium]